MAHGGRKSKLSRGSNEQVGGEERREQAIFRQRQNLFARYRVCGKRMAGSYTSDAIVIYI